MVYKFNKTLQNHQEEQGRSIYSNGKIYKQKIKQVTKQYIIFVKSKLPLPTTKIVNMHLEESLEKKYPKLLTIAREWDYREFLLSI